MADDWHCKQIPNGQHPIVVCERETLLAEIERLRAAGDALVAAIRNHDLTEQSIRAWEEARRG